MKLFNNDNTTGYTEIELDQLNEEWDKRFIEMKLEYGTEQYYMEAQAFSDEVAKR